MDGQYWYTYVPMESLHGTITHMQHWDCLCKAHGTYKYIAQWQAMLKSSPTIRNNFKSRNYVLSMYRLMDN